MVEVDDDDYVDDCEQEAEEVVVDANEGGCFPFGGKKKDLNTRINERPRF